MATATVPAHRVRNRAKQRECCRPKKGDEVEGSTHAATGFLLGAGIGLLTSTPHAHGIVAENVGRDLMYGLLTAGFALLPDSDHPKASFAYAAGWLSHGIAHIVAVLFGGHRQGMHSLFGIGLMMLVTASCADWWPNDWALGVLAALIAICVTAGLNAIGFARRGDGLLAGCVIAALAVTTVRADLWWLVALGMALHIAEDEFSGHGCALLWPFLNRRFGGDGRQLASRRAPRRAPARKGTSRRASARPPARPVTVRPPKTATTPYKPPRSFWPSICGECLDGECGECRDRGCQCTRRGMSHPNRSARGILPRRPVDTSEDDVPPF